MRDMVVLLNLDNDVSCSVAKKLRSEHLYCKLLPGSATAEEVLSQEAMGVLLCGAGTGEPVQIPELSRLTRCGLPLLALGDAALTLCEHLGGTVTHESSVPAVRPVRFSGDGSLTRDVQDGERYLPARCSLHLSGADAVTVASTDTGAVGFRVLDRPIYGLAFEPEQNDPDGVQLLLNFCRHICGCTLWWSSQAFIARATQEIERLADGGEAICAVSGGVDSAVCALLGNMALGHRLHCIFVDTGLMRKGEGDRVMDYFQNQVGLNIRRIGASAEFLAALRDTRTSGERQRAVFALLRSILRREVGQLENVRLILQGTNYADTLDSEPVCPLELTGAKTRIVEPVRELFKDEIRDVGQELQLPAALCQRQPFPGSGLALRITGEITRERLQLLREADAIFCQEIEASGQNKRLFQYYATLSGDPDTEAGFVVTLRAVQVVGGSSAIASRLPSDLLERVTERILTALPEVRRVVYDLTPSRSFRTWRSA